MTNKSEKPKEIKEWTSWMKSAHPAKSYFCFGWNIGDKKVRHWIKLVPQCKCHE